MGKKHQEKDGKKEIAALKNTKVKLRSPVPGWDL